MSRKTKSFIEFLEEKKERSRKEIERLEDEEDLRDAERIWKIYLKNPEQFISLEEFKRRVL